MTTTENTPQEKSSKKSRKQRAMVAARIATLRRGRPELNPSIDGISQPRAAELLNVSTSSVERASKVVNNGIPELIHEVEAGNMAVSAASRIVALEPEEQDLLHGHVQIVLGPRRRAGICQKMGRHHVQHGGKKSR
ncbi:MAG: hypothetical protein ACLP3B_22320 [Syntrophobacteraceae bacterium]